MDRGIAYAKAHPHPESPAQDRMGRSSSMSGPSSSPIAVASTGSMQATSLGVEDALGAVRQQQIDDFVAAYNFARRLKTLNGLTHYNRA
jgi:hypothetical protein